MQQLNPNDSSDEPNPRTLLKKLVLPTDQAARGVDSIAILQAMMDPE